MLHLIKNRYRPNAATLKLLPAMSRMGQFSSLNKTATQVEQEDIAPIVEEA